MARAPAHEQVASSVAHINLQLLSEEERRAFAFNIAGYVFLWIGCASAVLLHRASPPLSQLGYVVAGAIFVYLIAFSPATQLRNGDDAR